MALLLDTVMGWYRTEHAIRCGHFLISCGSPGLIVPDSSTSALWLQQKHLVVKQGVGKK
jgi:hypothetical protein